MMGEFVNYYNDFLKTSGPKRIVICMLMKVKDKGKTIKKKLN